MEFNIGFTVVQISSTQMLSLFWAGTVSASFNIAYYLFLKDRGSGAVSRARIAMTVIIGTLIVIGTYADMLAQKTFAMKDCLLLALVAAHGWMAEEMVQSFIKEHSKQQLPKPGA